MPMQAVELIDWYRARWEIEILFNVLKNGCRVEALQLGANQINIDSRSSLNRHLPPMPCRACLGYLMQGRRITDGA
jgi:hypothetical protein